MKFQPGRSGNPAGKVRGTKHRVTLLAERLMEDDAQDVVRTVIAAAKGGDMSACKLVLDRIAPIRRGAPIKFTLPELATASDLPAAITILTQAGGERHAVTRRRFDGHWDARGAQEGTRDRRAD